MCSRPPKLLWTVGTLSKIASIREPSVHEGFPSCLVLSIPNTPESCLVRSIPNSLFLLNALLNQWLKQADCVGLIQVHLLFGPRVEQGTSWASDTDGKGHCRGRSGSTDFVPGRNWTEIFDFHVRTWTEPNYAWKGPSQVLRSRISEHSRWAI